MALRRGAGEHPDGGDGYGSERRMGHIDPQRTSLCQLVNGRLQIAAADSADADRCSLSF